MYTLFPRRGLDLVKDCIHGYIYFTRPCPGRDSEATEKDLIDSPWVQRLRRIHQLQTAWLVYPAADHNRFSHSLGTMHLAGEFARAVYEPFKRLHRNSKLMADLPETEHVVETFRVAGLLHDIGHWPFSHLCDECVLRPHGYDHEFFSARIIKHELGDIIRNLRRSPAGAFETPIDPDIVARLVVGSEDERLEKGKRPLSDIPVLTKFWRPLSQIIRGAYDSDKLDFLLRDALVCGQSGTTIAEVSRLINMTFLSDNGQELVLESSSIPVLLGIIRHRQDMFRVVYYHRTVRIFELMIAETLNDLFRYILPDGFFERPALEHLLDCDEWTLLAVVKQSIREGHNSAEPWKRVFARQKDWFEVYRYEWPLYDVTKKRLLLRGPEVEERIKEQLKRPLKFRVDCPSVENPGNIFGMADQNVVVYDPVRGRTTKTIRHIARDGNVPLVVPRYSVLAWWDTDDEARRALSEAAERVFQPEEASSSQLTSY